MLLLLRILFVLGRHFLVLCHSSLLRHMKCPILAFSFSSFSLTRRKMHYCCLAFFVDLGCFAGADIMFDVVRLAIDDRFAVLVSG
jgi:hypothetical protein